MEKKFRDEKDFMSIRDTLGSDYAETVIRFFCNVMASDFDYVVVMSRRCFVLYRIFFRLLRPLGRERKVSELVTDKAIARLLATEGLEEKSCLILDDILIHGRTVSRVYHRLREAFGQVRIYVCASSLDCYRRLGEDVMSEMADITFSEERVSSSGWKRLSEKLVEVIQRFREPYTSFLLSFFIHHSFTDGEFPQCERFRWKAYRENTRMDSLAVLFEDEVPEFFSKYCDQVCLRIVSWDGGACVTPTAFLKPVSSTGLPGFLRDLCQDLPDGFSSVVEWLSMDSSRTEMGRFQYRLATALISVVYGSYALSRLGLDVRALDTDIQTLSCSFSPEIAACIQRQLGSSTGWMEQPSAASEAWTFQEFRESAELESDFCQCMELDMQDVHTRLLKYFFMNGIKDEKTVISQTSIARDIGLSTPNMVQLASERGVGEQQMYAGLVAVWDTGRGSMDISENGSYFATFNCAGERSYRSINECLGQHISNLRYLEDVLLCDDIQPGREMRSKVEFSNCLRKVFTKYCDCAGERFGWSTQTMELVKHFINFVVEHQVSIGDYELESQDGEGNKDSEIADFGRQFVKNKLGMLAAV